MINFFLSFYANYHIAGLGVCFGYSDVDESEEQYANLFLQFDIVFWTLRFGIVFM